jgi:co-chaperonin GroES (HSP10)
MSKEQFVTKYFPEIEAGREPCGNKITVQLMFVPRTHSSGLILANDTQDFNKNATVVCRIIKTGPIAYKHRDTGEDWKEGAWAQVGDIVLMPRYGGMNRVEIPLPDNKDESIIFSTYNDYDVVDKVTGQFEHYTKLL